MSQQVATPLYNSLLEKLRHSGLKVTTPRQSLLTSLIEFSHPFTAEEVVAKLTDLGHHVHRATVYRDLLLFVQAGILTELTIQGVQAHYYEVAQGKHHHHFVCQSCFSIQDIYPDHVELAVAKYEEELRASGLHVESHQLKIYGKCQHCLQKEHANLRSSLSV